MKSKMIGKIKIFLIIFFLLGANAVESLHLNIAKGKDSKYLPRYWETKGNILYVGGVGPGNYSSIQDAIDNATDGDTIFVYDDSSPYYENIVIHKSINLIGENKETTIINGGESNVITILAGNINISDFTLTGGPTGSYNNNGIYLYYSSYTTITNCTIFNNGHNGIRLHYSSYTTITNCTIFNNSCYGVAIGWKSNYTTITNCTIFNNSWGGIYLYHHSSYTTITNCAISNEPLGIYLCNSTYNTFTYNTFTNNGIFICGNLSTFTTQSIDLSNTVNSKPIYYWKNKTGGVVPPGAGEVILANCSNVIIEDQLISDSTVGIETGFSKNITIVNCTIFNNSGEGIYIDWNFYTTIVNCTIFNNNWGICLFHSSYTIITNCTVFNNSWDGVDIYKNSNYTTITNCTIFNNSGEGIQLYYSNYTTITNCTIFNNDGAGIWVCWNSNYTTITNCTIFNNSGEGICGEGIYIDWNFYTTIVNCTIFNNNWGICLFHSSYTIITNCTVFNNSWDGVDIYKNSNYTTITNCTIFNNSGEGILITSNSNYTTITNCTIFNNSGEGIQLYYSNYTTITNCTISNNYGGIYFRYSNYSMIYLNAFYGNNYNVIVDSTCSGNVWNSSYPIQYIYNGFTYISHLGNYWEGYTGQDSNDDGIGDAPYCIDDSNIDHYPLMVPPDELFSSLPRCGELIVSVYNVDGSPAASVHGTTTVELIKEGESTPFAEETINEYSQAIFHDIPEGEYYINVWHDPQVDDGDVEFWGQQKDISVTAGTTTIDFQRYNPYVEAFYAKERNIELGETAEVNVTIKVPSNYIYPDVDVEAMLIIRNESGVIKYMGQSSVENVNRGGSFKFTFYYQPDDYGVYYGLAKAILVGGGEICTDNCGWSELFNVGFTEIKLVAGDNNLPVVFVNVSIWENNVKITEDITGLNGVVDFMLPPGTYTVKFLDDEKNIQVPCDEIVFKVSESSMKKIRSTGFIIYGWMDGMILDSVEFEFSHNERKVSGILEKTHRSFYLLNYTVFKVIISKEGYIPVEFKFNTSSLIQNDSSSGRNSNNIIFRVYLLAFSNYEKSMHTGFEPFLDGYSFYNFGTEIEPSGTCFGMVSTAGLYYGYRTGWYQHKDSEIYVLPLPLDDCLYTSYTPEYYIDYDKETGKSGYYDVNDKLDRKPFDGLELTPVDDIQLAMLFHQAYQSKLKIEYSTGQIEEVLNLLDDGYPVMIQIKKLVFTLPNPIPSMRRHEVMAFSYIKDDSCVYFAVYDPNDPLCFNWLMYNVSTGETIFQEYPDWDLEAFYVAKTAKYDDFKPWLQFGSSNYYITSFLDGYKLVASNSPLALTSSTYGVGYFDGTNYVSNLIPFSHGFMEYSKVKNNEGDYNLKDAFYVVIYPKNIYPMTIETGTASVDPVTLVSINNSHVTGLNVESTKLTAIYDKWGNYEILANNTLQIESFNITANRSISNIFTLQLPVESLVNLSEDRLYVDIGNDSSIDEVFIPPVSNFSFCLYDSSVFFNASGSYDPDGYIVNYTWDFGDGNSLTVTQPLVNHTYSAGGIYTVNLTVTDDDGITSTLSKQIKIATPPVADFTYSPSSPKVNEKITFNASGSYDPDGGGIVNYTWNFGDGGASYGMVIKHTYTQPGVYTVTLTVIDSDGLSNSTTMDVEVVAQGGGGNGGGPSPGGPDHAGSPPTNNPPVADVGGPYYGFVGEPIEFNASGSYDPDNDTLTYTWDFGDGSSGSGVIVTHVYHSTGTFTVTLTVSDGTDSSTVTTSVVIVKPNNPPSKPIIKGLNNGHMGIPYTYTIISVDPDNDSLQYYIDWGDGSNYTSGFVSSNLSLVVNHSWLSAGKYIIKVKAYDNQTFSAISSYIVYIDSLAIGDIGYLIDEDGDNIYDRFHNESSGLESSVVYKDGRYLIDADNDGSWDYSFTEDKGLVKYVEEERNPANALTTALVAIIIIAIIAILFVLAYQKKKS